MSIIQCPLKGGICWGTECKFYGDGCRIDGMMHNIEIMARMMMKYVELQESAQRMQSYQARTVTEKPVHAKVRK